MGNCCFPTRFRRTSSAINPKNITLLLLGLDNAGKTTIAKRLAGEPIDSVVPTVGFSVVMIRQRNCHLSIYDLGGGLQIRDIWPRYYADAHGVIFVVDAQDAKRLEECGEVLQNLLRHEQISGKPVLLLANKQDLDGALDEIDVVERLCLERLVNEQKCPTLVELCSALNFSKKMDIGIDNGYKWMIRSIIRDYPSLNNRVLKDLAKQEEANKVHFIKQPERKTKWDIGDADEIMPYGCLKQDPFMPIQKVLEKGYPNGVPKFRVKNEIRSVARIPGMVDDLPEKAAIKKSHVQRFLSEDIVSVPEGPTRSTPNSYNSEFFFEQFQSDLELLNNVPNQTLRNFLVRPKSSGARLYGVKSERKKIQRRRPLKKTNKTGPAPFTDISNNQKGAGGPSAEEDSRNPSNQTSVEILNPFVISDSRLFESKSMPNSRKNSLPRKKRRHSMANESIELSPLKVSNRLPSTKEILLDVNKLSRYYN